MNDTNLTHIIPATKDAITEAAEAAATEINETETTETVTAKHTMKITMPLATMLEGLRLGGAIALKQTPKGMVRFSVKKSAITVESGNMSQWVVHTIPMSSSISVEGEGICCFKICDMNKSIKIATEYETVKPPSAKYTFSMTLNYAPLSEIATGGRILPHGNVDWTIYRDEEVIMQIGIDAYPSESIDCKGGIGDVYGLRDIDRDDGAVLELYVSVARDILEDIEMAGKGLQSVIIIRNGLIYMATAGNSHAIMREITPSGIISFKSRSNDCGSSMRGLYILEAILKGVRSLKSVKVSLPINEGFAKWSMGDTELFLSCIPNNNIPIDILTRPSSTSFAIESGMLIHALAHPICSSVHASQVHASLKENGSVLKFRYEQSKHSGEVQKPCSDVNGDSSVRWSFAPKIVRKFAKGNARGKMVIEIVPAKINIMRVRSDGNPNATLILKTIE